MIASDGIRKSGLIGLIAACLLSTSGITGCKSYTETEKSEGKTIKTITLPVNKGTYTGLFHKPIIYGGMDGNNTFYLYPSYDSHILSPFNASSKNITYYEDKYDVLNVTPDTIILRYSK